MSSREESAPRPGILGSARTNLSGYEASDEGIGELIARRVRHLGGSVLFYDDPIAVVQGEGAWLIDAAGRRYLDCYNNVQSVGHGNPAVADAIDRQNRLLTVHTRYLHPLILDYAEALSATLPAPLEVCFFTCSGTEANELAIRIARTVTGKAGVLVMENSYHGNSQLVSALSTAVPGPRPDFVATLAPPDSRGVSIRDVASDIAGATAWLAASGHGAAAFLCDAIFDSQGGLEAPPDYFAAAYAACRERGMLCIADEVQAGFGRTGRMWGFSHYGVVPDIVTLGKPIGNGYPLGVVVTSAEIADHFMHSEVYFNTFGGNPVAAAAGLAVLREIEERRLVDHVAKVGIHLRAGLDALVEEFDMAGSVQGRGLYQGLDIVTDPDSRSPAHDLGRRILEDMKRQGVLVGLTGRFGNVVKIRPPLVIDRSEIDLLLAALRKALDSARG